jgi:type I restriction enzyme, S subunit
MNWLMVELGRVAEIRGGATPQRDNPEYWNGDIPWLTPTDLPPVGAGITDVVATEDVITEEGLSSCSASLLPPGTVLFSSRASIGKVGIAAVPLTTNQGFANLIPRPGVESRYLAWSMHFFADRISGLAGSTIFKEVSKSALKRFRVPLPPPSEQRRIVEILDQADRLRRLRSEADSKADRILPVLFIKMFGDPTRNPMGWVEEPLRNTIESVEAGWSANGESRQRLEHEYGVLKVSAVTSGVLLAREHKAVAPESVNQDLVSLRRGDLLVSRANTRELVAASCVVEADEPMLFLSDKLWRVVPRRERATSMYLKQLFWVPAFRDRFRARATGTSGSMLNLSQESFLSTLAPLPPIALQEKFTERANGLVIAREDARRCRDRLSNLRTSLLMLAFSGQLTSSWRETHLKGLLQEMEYQAEALGAVRAKVVEKSRWS